MPLTILFRVHRRFTAPGGGTAGPGGEFAVLERPFARVTLSRQPDGRTGGFVVGLALGLLFVPCAGPILAAITVAGGELAQRTAALRRQARRVREASGVVVLVMALLIGLNTFSGLQRDVPGYTSSLQNRVEGGSGVRKQLSALNKNVTRRNATLASCNSKATTLIDCGPAPDFAGITAWLNTPGGRPLTMAGLRGKVVLVDFWTYSCINCQRSLPHVEGWYRQYAKDGFVVVGVHTPEFSFEHVVSNVRAESAALGVRYPVAVDDGYKTWDAYDNEYWPADYLIDAQSDVRHVSFGEGGYADMGNLIRQLLVSAHHGRAVPAPTSVPTGHRRGRAEYVFPASLPAGALGWSGTWTDHAEEATAGPHARMELGFIARYIYLVIGGSGTLDVSIDGRHTQTIDVGGVPKLYTLLHAPATTSGTLQFSASPGIQAYDFTFG